MRVERHGIFAKLLNLDGNGSVNTRDMLAVASVFFIAFGSIAAGYVIADLPEVTRWFETPWGQLFVCLSISAGILNVSSRTSFFRVILCSAILFAVLQALRTLGHHVVKKDNVDDPEQRQRCRCGK